MSTYNDCLDLAEKLPYFRKDDYGRTYLIDKPAYQFIDFHSHLGLAFYFAGRIDYTSSARKTEHEFPLEGVPIDMEIYAGANAAKYLRKKWHSASLNKAFTCKAENRTHTIPNLLEETKRFNVGTNMYGMIGIEWR